MLWTPSAQADEASHCHDMRASQSVLNEGTQYLREHGDVSMNRFGNDWDVPTFIPPKKPASPPEFTGLPPLITSESQWATIALDTPAQLKRAEMAAWWFELTRQFGSANQLYMRILKQKEVQSTASDSLAQTLEAAARTEILSIPGDATTDRKALRIGKRPLSFGPGLDYTPDKQANERLIMHDAIKDSYEVFSNNRVEAEALYTRALATRRKLTSYESSLALVSDLLALAALNERRDNSSDAKALYTEAFKLDSHTGQYLMGFCVEHKDLDLVKHNEAKVLDAVLSTGDREAKSTLLSMYVMEKKSTEALTLFRQIMKEQVYAQADALISMFDLISTDKVDKVTQYVGHVWIDPSSINKDFGKVMHAMEAHGWDAQADAICQSVVHDATKSSSVRPLFAVADSYRQSKKYERAMSTYKEIGTLLEIQHEDDQDALKYLPELISAINSGEMKRQPGSRALVSHASELIKFYKDHVDRHQCLAMADKLNHTAFTLERNSDYAMAQKLYQQALEIKRLNLIDGDPETADQILDVARMAADQKHYFEAQSLYEHALNILRKSPHTDRSETVRALENYGQMLNQIKQEAKADRIYGEARELLRNTQN